MGEPSSRRSQDVGSSERRKTDKAQRNMEEDSENGIRPKWLRISKKKKIICLLYMNA